MKTQFFYRRNLPHLQCEGSYYFLTFRLYKSLQTEIVEKLKNYYQRNKTLISQIKNRNIRDEKLYNLQKKYFGVFDRHLDLNKECINYLCDPRIAGIVDQAVKYRDGNVYELISHCIMPNHVHMLIYVERFVKPLYRIMQSLKIYTATECNKIVNRKGPFWHEETYDHVVRNKGELFRIIDYINLNPVKAGLIDSPEKWKWSYNKLFW